MTLAPVVTASDLIASTRIQVHAHPGPRGSPGTDGDATRQATLRVPSGTTDCPAFPAKFCDLVIYINIVVNKAVDRPVVSLTNTHA